jgi:predicted outer membrane protein
MNPQTGSLVLAAAAAALLSAPLALAAGSAPMHADAFMKKAIQGNLAEIKEGQLAGSRFDAAFVKSAVQDHRRTIAKYKQEAGATNGPAATYASTSLPVLHEHLRLAEALQRRPGG